MAEDAAAWVETQIPRWAKAVQVEAPAPAPTGDVVDPTKRELQETGHVTCGECGKAMAQSEITCPHCGLDRPGMMNKVTYRDGKLVGCAVDGNGDDWGDGFGGEGQGVMG